MTILSDAGVARIGRFAVTAFLCVTVVAVAYIVYRSGSPLAALRFMPQLVLVLALAFLFVPAAGPELPKASTKAWATMAALAAMAASLIPLWVSWSGLDSHSNYIGGIVPWKDAAHYYAGAEHLLHTGELGSWGQRRPVNEILLAFRLALTGNDFRYALMIQACLFGACGFLAARAVALGTGIRAGVALFALLLAFAAHYIPTTLTESLGISLGALAFTVLWWAVAQQRKGAYFIGLFLLGFALTARPGAMLVLVTLSLYAGRLARDETRFRPGAVILALVVVVAATSITWILAAFRGDGTGAGFSNFATIFYGLVAGGKGWNQVYIDFPQLQSMTEGQAASFIYKQAWAMFLASPHLVMKAIFFGFLLEPLRFLRQLVRLLFLGSGGGSPPVPMLLVDVMGPVFTIAAAVQGIASVKDGRWKTHGEFLSFFWLGFVGSLPFFYLDGGIRSVAATHPFVAATLVLLLLPQFRNPSVGDIRVDSDGPCRCAQFLGLILVLVLFLFPRLLPLYPAPEKKTPDWICEPGQTPKSVRLSRGVPAARIWVSSSAFNSRNQIVLPDGDEAANLFRDVPAPGTLVFAYDSVSQSCQYLFYPGEVYPSENEGRGCATNRQQGIYSLWIISPVKDSTTTQKMQTKR